MLLVYSHQGSNSYILLDWVPYRYRSDYSAFCVSAFEMILSCNNKTIIMSQLNNLGWNFWSIRTPKLRRNMYLVGRGTMNIVITAELGRKISRTKTA